MFSLILAESSLELVPREIRHHPSIVSHARKLGKKPSEILLDNSWHFGAMKGIKNELKRGRPDIVHYSLLEATSIPLYFEKKIKIYVHTINDKVIYLGDDVHLPKSYHRFAGLMEKLFAQKTIESNGSTLLEIEDQSFSELIDDLNPEKIVGLSSEGNSSTFDTIATKLNENTSLVIGGFQKDNFSNEVKEQFTDLFSASPTPLEAHVVVARMLYEYEKTVFM